MTGGQIWANNSTTLHYSKNSLNGYFFMNQASTRLRLKTKDIRLENDSRVGTPICQNLQGVCVKKDYIWIPHICVTSLMNYPSGMVKFSLKVLFANLFNFSLFSANFCYLANIKLS